MMAATPAWAVFNERNLAQTLQVLRYELCKAYSEMEARHQAFEKRDEVQHQELVRLIHDCNELSLMLYSQKQDFTFDLTYALQQVTDHYHNFSQNRVPYDNIISFLDVEIERYDRLLGALKLLPPELVEVPDSLGPKLLDSLTMSLHTHLHGNHPHAEGEDPHQDEIMEMIGADEHDEEDEDHHHGSFNLDSLSLIARDSCIFYTEKLFNMYSELREHLVEDNELYETTNKRLKDAYEYAQGRYKLVQKKIFIDGQNNYWKVLRNFSRSLSQASTDFEDKYADSFLNDVKSEWRGPRVLGFSLNMLVFLLFAILVSYVVIALLKRKVRYFGTESFQKREFTIHLLVSAVLFSLTLVIIRQAVNGLHFFRMASGLLLEFTLLMVAILASILIRNSGKQVNSSLRLYAPVLLMGLIVISFRIIFIPNSLINLIYSPLLLFFGVWGQVSLRRYGKVSPKVDRIFAIVSQIVTLVTLLAALLGYSLMGLQLYIWWIFQLTVLQIIMACKYLIHRYRHSKVEKMIRAYRMKHPSYKSKTEGAFIQVTWLYDLLDMAILPVLIVASFPGCLYMASKVFDLTEVCMNAFSYAFFNYDYLHLSMSKIVIASGLFFVFKYLSYVLKSSYGVYKMHRAIQMSGTGFVRENEVNLTLPNNVIGIVVWGAYAIVIVSLLSIPTDKISVIIAGLAAGLGFALKDILNNFFYGVQLMSGRLRVGDTIECDGVRGTVDNISYQTTQIIGVDGSLIAFPNSTLFAKTFKNLTKSDSYECVSLPVGVAYGTDVEYARKVIIKALAPLRKEDKFGRMMIKESFGIQVLLINFGDSSVDLLVKQFVLVEQRNAYIAKANELIYKALNEKNIEIPFPQVDVNFKNTLQSEQKNNID